MNHFAELCHPRMPTSYGRACGPVASTVHTVETDFFIDSLTYVESDPWYKEIIANGDKFKIKLDTEEKKDGSLLLGLCRKDLNHGIRREHFMIPSSSDLIRQMSGQHRLVHIQNFL